MKIFCNLSGILKDNNIKQVELCKMSGVSKQTISNCIKQRANVSLIVALKISKALDLQIEDIWKIKD